MAKNVTVATMRYRLRTLLILLAVGPAMVAVVAMRHMEKVDASDQQKDRQTRKSLYIVQNRMDFFLARNHEVPPSEDLIMLEWEHRIQDACGQPALDPWGRGLDVGWRSHFSELYARSYGPNGRDNGGAGDDVEVSCLIPDRLRQRDDRQLTWPQSDDSP